MITEKYCEITKQSHNWNNMRLTGKDEWVMSPLCRETGHYFHCGTVTTDQVKEYLKVKNALWKLHKDTLILISKLAKSNGSGFKQELKVFKDIEQEWSESTLKKDRSTLTMEEHISFLTQYINELNDLGHGNVELSTKNYDAFKDQFLKGRSYMDFLEVV